MKRFAPFVRFTAAIIYSFPDLKARLTSSCAKTMFMNNMITKAADT